MNVFILVILVLFHTPAGNLPAAAVKIYPDKFSCQQAEGQIATQLEADKTVLGYSLPVECEAKQTGQKV